MTDSIFSGPFESGTVWLVGAGPGDPGLLTLAAAEAVEQAEVIVYDALVSDAILRMARSGVELRYAGKRGGKPSMKQRDISLTLVELARKGKKVLRLKGGDPYLFGRGGEEVLALVRHGVKFKVIPGVSAGLGGLACAGIPLTHRGINHSVTFVTGHDASGLVPDSMDWESISKASPVLVLYMAMKHWGNIRERLLSAGRNPEESVAFVSEATTSRQKVLETNLKDSLRDLESSDLRPPAVVAVGEAVRMRAALDWLGAEKEGIPLADPFGDSSSGGASRSVQTRRRTG